jgi:hypothetical protein
LLHIRRSHHRPRRVRRPHQVIGGGRRSGRRRLPRRELARQSDSPEQPGDITSSTAVPAQTRDWAHGPGNDGQSGRPPAQGFTRRAAARFRRGAVQETPPPPPRRPASGAMTAAALYPPGPARRRPARGSRGTFPSTSCQRGAALITRPEAPVLGRLLQMAVWTSRARSRQPRKSAMRSGRLRSAVRSTPSRAVQATRGGGAAYRAVTVTVFHCPQLRQSHADIRRPRRLPGTRPTWVLPSSPAVAPARVRECSASAPAAST